MKLAMKISTIFLLAVLLVLQIPTVLCSSWWSIVSGSEVYDPTNKMTPVHLECGDFASILDESQLQLCKQHRKLLSTTAIGALQALNQCQKLFKNRAWNCSVFDSSAHYLGRFIDNGTRETAFLNAIISAGIAREVARKCREATLDACNCDFSVTGGKKETKDGTVTVYAGCGDNDEFGVQIAKAFTDTSIGDLNDSFSLMSLHNNEVGRALVRNTTVACICHGVSGSCSVQTCFKKVPDIEQIGIELVKKYDVARHVKANKGALRPIGNTVPPLKKDELAYIGLPPNFCKQDLRNGIFGTSGRRCYPDKNDYSSCTNLCCNGADHRVVQLKEDRNKCGKFVWCCYIDYSNCGTYEETWYFCK